MARPRRELDPAELGSAVYPLLNSLVVPRPIAWVSSRSPAGVDNLAPHSYFTVSSVTPPVVQFTSVGEKDSLRNVLATGEFVVAVCTEALAELVNDTATNFPPEVSEFDAVGLTREPASRVSAARVAESPVALECRLAGSRDFGTCTVVFGEVVHIAVAEEVLDGELADIRRLSPVARLGRNDWGTVGEVSSRRRVPYQQWPGRRR